MFGLFVLVMMLGVSSRSWGAQYDAKSVGKTIPLWMELSTDVNEQGDVVWSEQLDGFPNARILLNDHTDSITLSNANVSTAHGLTELRDGVRWVVGSKAPSPRMNTRTATLWRVDTRGATPNVTSFNLAELTPQNPQGDPNETVQQSAAYDIVEYAQDQFYIVGFARDKVSNDVLPQPVIWTVAYEDGEISTTVKWLDGWSGGGVAPNGIATTISDDGDWVCGQGAPVGAYMQAACWSRGSGAPYTALNDALETAFGSVPIASVVHRVRTIDLIDPDASSGSHNFHSYAVGAAMIGGVQDGTSLSGGTWRGFAYDLTDKTVWSGFDFTEDGHSDSLLYDVAGAYFPNSSGNRLNNGPVFGGTSATVGAGTDNLLNPGPWNMGETNTMRAVFRNTISTPNVDNGVVCKVDEDSTTVTGSHSGQSYDQLVAMSNDAHFRLAVAGDTLYRLEQKKTAFQVEFFNRTTTKRTTSANRAAPIVYTQAKAIFPSGIPNQALVRFGEKLGCGTIQANGIGSCANHPAAFDIVSGKILLFDTSISGGLSTVKTTGAFSLDPNLYAQGVTRTHDDVCTISAIASSAPGSIVPVDAVAINERSTTGKAKNTEDADYDGTLWRYCGAGPEWIDAKTDYDHCGACDQSADDSKVCTNNVCINGARQATANGNGCWIDGNSTWGQGSCVATNTLNTSIFQNQCSICNPTQNPADWSPRVYRAPVYRCIAHHDSSGIAKTKCVDNSTEFAGAFYGDGNNCLTSDRSNNRAADFRTNDYETNRLCARFNQDTNTGTMNLSNSTYWEIDANAYNKPLPVWPNDFFYMAHNEYQGTNNFTQSKAVRDWIFARRMHYLGQMTDKVHRTNAEVPVAASTFYLPVTQSSGGMLSDPEWFAVYYNDENKQRDKIIVTVNYDTTQMDLDMELHYACAHGTNNHPRLDGISHCGPEGGQTSMGVESCMRRWYDPINPNHDKNDKGRYTSCRATKGTVNGAWGEGMRLVGQLDCSTKPSDTSRTRDGWVFVRVQRRQSSNSAKNNSQVCTPLTITFQSDNTKPDQDIAVQCTWDP